MSQKFNELISSEGLILIDFFATWCQPCKVMSQVLTTTKQKVGTKARIVKIDIDAFPDIAAAQGVRSVPTLILFKNGEPIWRQSGVVDVQTLIHLLESHV